MKTILNILGNILMTLLAFLFHIVVWSPVIILMSIFVMIGWMLATWLGITLLSILILTVILKFVIDLKLI